MREQPCLGSLLSDARPTREQSAKKNLLSLRVLARAGDECKRLLVAAGLLCYLSCTLRIKLHLPVQAGLDDLQRLWDREK